MFDEERLGKVFAKVKEDMLFLAQEILTIKQEIQEIKQILQNLNSSTYPTQVQHPTHTPAQDLENYTLNQQDFHCSIGNEGVPTDSQQTVNRQSNTLKRTSDTAKIISTLGNLKQDLKEKFKKLTQQEFLVFSVLYTLEEEVKNVTYKDLAQRTGLAESSIRDYISRLEHKGLPITKERINNRVVILRIPRELKEITSLSSLNNL